MVSCQICNFEYSHIVGTIQVVDNDSYKATKVIINNEYSILTKVPYEYRSQGNIHILFRCEEGHFFIISFDGHKGMVFFNDNRLMDELVEYLNQKYNNQHEFSLSLDSEILGNIENFFRKKETVL